MDCLPIAQLQPGEAFISPTLTRFAAIEEHNDIPATLLDRTSICRVVSTAEPDGTGVDQEVLDAMGMFYAVLAAHGASLAIDNSGILFVTPGIELVHPVAP